MSDGFLGRWSRRKLEVKEGRPVEAEPVRTEPLPPAEPSPEAARSVQVSPAARLDEQGLEGGIAPQPVSGPTDFPSGVTPTTLPSVPQEGAAEPRPALTLEDVKALTADSDFTRFAGADVAPAVKNAALKKLFTDPHYNVMDGLDVYIDDYSKPDPMSHSVLRQLVSAKFLGLFEQEEKEEAEAAARQARDVADNPTAQIVAQSRPAPPAVPERTDDADPDLRLQQDDAPPGEDPGRGDR